MNAPESYSAWAPVESPWSAWVKPVLFAGVLPPAVEPLVPDESAPGDEPPARLSALRAVVRDSFVIVDEPGAQSVATGLALARQGFRPVPLFNGVDGEPPIVPVEEIVKALVRGARQLSRLNVRAAAPPAFLLDARRLEGVPKPGAFDNRWVVTPEDFPSANRLLAAGLRRCVIIGRSRTEDLPHVLLRYQRSGIDLQELNEAGHLVAHTVKRPSAFGTLFARILVAAGLRRSSAGGFGSYVPVPEQGGGGYG